jgi:hypothetical protein
MGNLAQEIQSEGLSSSPCVTEVQHLVIATVSNWAAYGIVAYLSKKKNTDFMRFVTVRPILEQLVAQGVVDGVTTQPTLTVDGYALETIEALVVKLCEDV